MDEKDGFFLLFFQRFCKFEIILKGFKKCVSQGLNRQEPPILCQRS